MPTCRVREPNLATRWVVEGRCHLWHKRKIDELRPVCCFDPYWKLTFCGECWFMHKRSRLKRQVIAESPLVVENEVCGVWTQCRHKFCTQFENYLHKERVFLYNYQCNTRQGLHLTFKNMYIYPILTASSAYKYIIHTESRVFTGFKNRDKKTEAQPRFFLSRLSCKHEAEVCITIDIN